MSLKKCGNLSFWTGSWNTKLFFILLINAFMKKKSWKLNTFYALYNSTVSIIISCFWRLFSRLFKLFSLIEKRGIVCTIYYQKRQKNIIYIYIYITFIYMYKFSVRMKTFIFKKGVFTVLFWISYNVLRCKLADTLTKAVQILKGFLTL